MSSFFRVLIDEYATKLRIPSLFVSRFSCLTPKTVTLVCSSKRSWKVDIEEGDHKELYFKRGWNTFVEDNALETGEFVVFKFDGNSTFKANIFGKSYLRRKAPMSMPSFFKVLVDSKYTTKLRIPLLFVSKYSTLVPKRVTLIRASSNRSWKVDIEEEDDKRLYYKNGWSTFVEDNALEIAQFLVFKFDGDSTFKVKIYGNSACEKELENQPCINQNYCIQHYKQTTTRLHQETQREIDPIHVDRQKSGLNVEITEERVDHDDYHNSNQGTGAPQKEVEEEQSNGHIALQRESQREQSNEHIALQHESHSPIRNSGKGSTCEGPMLKESSEAPKLSPKKIPSFKILLQQAYAEKGVMCFPTEFFKKHMKNKRQEVEIETIDGVWKVTLLPHMKRTRTFARFSKGWSEFAKANHFKTGETLIFKMVGRGECPKFIVDRQ